MERDDGQVEWSGVEWKKSENRRHALLVRLSAPSAAAKDAVDDVR
jgi:hypothetical protein